MIFTWTLDQALALFFKQQPQLQTLLYSQPLQVEQLIPSRLFQETSLVAAQALQTSLLLQQTYLTNPYLQSYLKMEQSYKFTLQLLLVMDLLLHPTSSNS